MLTLFLLLLLLLPVSIEVASFSFVEVYDLCQLSLLNFYCRLLLLLLLCDHIKCNAMQKNSFFLFFIFIFIMFFFQFCQMLRKNVAHCCCCYLLTFSLSCFAELCVSPCLSLCLFGVWLPLDKAANCATSVQSAEPPLPQLWLPLYCRCGTPPAGTHRRRRCRRMSRVADA